MSFILDKSDSVYEVRDPFFGGPVLTRRLGPGAWVGGAMTGSGSYYTRIFGTREELLDALKQRAECWKPAGPAEKPLETCPFTGEKVIWDPETCQLKGSFWISSPFWAIEQAQWFLSARDGIEPSFPRERVVIVGERAPDLVKAAQEIIDNRTKKGQGNGHQVADKILSINEPAFGKRAQRDRG
jgi:hypothetical protein